MKHSKELSISYETLVRFLEASKGNYRNAVYVQCTACRYCREENCGDFLFIPGFDCVPILLPLADAKKVIGSIDPTDCACMLSNSSFFHLYHQWLILQTDSSDTCPFHQILHLTNP